MSDCVCEREREKKEREYKITNALSIKKRQIIDGGRK